MRVAVPRSAVAALALTLAACANAPRVEAERRELPELPATFEAVALEEGALDDDWWLAFGDPGLVAAIDTALANNRDLGAAAARLAQAAAIARIEGADRLPRLDAGFDASRSRQVFVGLPIPGDDPLTTTTNNYGVSLDLTWELDLWGRLSAKAAAGRLDYEAAIEDLRGARLSLAAQTAKAWFAAVEARLQVDLAERTVESRRRSTDSVRRRYDLGLGSPGDVHVAASELATARAQLDLRSRRFDSARRQLEVLLGEYPEGLVEVAADLPDPPDALPPGLPSALLASRPDLAAAEKRLRAADERVEAARAELYPRIALTASGGTRSDDLGDLLDGDFRVWSIAGNLVQPIFQGGRLRAGVDLADARAAEAHESFAQTLLDACREVEFSLASESLLASREGHLRTATDSAQRAEAVGDQRYRQGVDSVLELLLVQRQSLAAEASWLDARRERLENRIDLHLALGGPPVAPADEPEAADDARPADSDVPADIDAPDAPDDSAAD